MHKVIPGPTSAYSHAHKKKLLRPEARISRYSASLWTIICLETQSSSMAFSHLAT